jgi:hypothetical protein
MYHVSILKSPPEKFLQLVIQTLVALLFFRFSCSMFARVFRELRYSPVLRCLALTTTSSIGRGAYFSLVFNLVWGEMLCCFIYQRTSWNRHLTLWKADVCTRHFLVWILANICGKGSFLRPEFKENHSFHFQKSNWACTIRPTWIPQGIKIQIIA